MGGRGSKLSPCDIEHLLQTTSFTRSQIKTWHRGFMVSENLLTSINIATFDNHSYNYIVMEVFMFACNVVKF